LQETAAISENPSFRGSPEAGETFTLGALRIVGRVIGAQSGNAIELYDLVRGNSPSIITCITQRSLVRSPFCAESILRVIEGEIEFTVAGEKFLRKAGPVPHVPRMCHACVVHVSCMCRACVVHVPRGVDHGFSNLGPGPARVLVLFNPSGNQSPCFRTRDKLEAAPTNDGSGLPADGRTFLAVNSWLLRSRVAVPHPIGRAMPTEQKNSVGGSYEPPTRCCPTELLSCSVEPRLFSDDGDQRGQRGRGARSRLGLGPQ
jgi:hypothetical protein